MQKKTLGEADNDDKTDEELLLSDFILFFTTSRIKSSDIRLLKPAQHGGQKHQEDFQLHKMISPTSSL